MSGTPGDTAAPSRLGLLGQQVLPRRTLSALAGCLARLEGGALTTAAIRLFVRHYGVDLSEAAQSDPAAYRSFNAFFTRALRTGARPLAGDDATLVSPADGVLSRFGGLEQGVLVQAKGFDYDLPDLLDGDRTLAARFSGGAYATIYLAPHNYHRVHLPLTARLDALRHVPGELYAVNAATAGGLPRLFVRNERIIAVASCGDRALGLVMVGALNVGSIDIVLENDGAASNRPRATLPPHATVTLAQGERPRGAEFGRFNLGSTVILLLGPGLARFDADLVAGQQVRVGQRLGRCA